MLDHHFTLILNGIDDTDPQIIDALYEAGCDDAVLASRDDVVSLTFTREAESYDAAVESARRDVLNANVGAEIVGIIEEPN